MTTIHLAFSLRSNTRAAENHATAPRFLAVLEALGQWTGMAKGCSQTWPEKSHRLRTSARVAGIKSRTAGSLIKIKIMVDLTRCRTLKPISHQVPGGEDTAQLGEDTGCHPCQTDLKVVSAVPKAQKRQQHRLLSDLHHHRDPLPAGPGVGMSLVLGPRHRQPRLQDLLRAGLEVLGLGRTCLLRQSRTQLQHPGYILIGWPN